MENKQLKKEVQQLVKKYSLDIICIDGLSCKFKSAGFQSLIFMNQQKKELGWLQYSYVSNRFSEVGSVFGFSVCEGFRMNEFSIRDIPEQFKLLRLLTECDLSYKNRCIVSDCYFGFSSLNTLREYFYNKGTVSIFENDNVDEKIKQVVVKISEIYLPRIVRFLYGNLDLLKDILEYPHNFGYPLATALAVCKLHDRTDLFSTILERSKSIERMQLEVQNLTEICSKLNINVSE